MTLALVFNDISLPYEKVADAKVAVLRFIKTALACRKYGFNLILILLLINRGLVLSWLRDIFGVIGSIGQKNKLN